MCIFLSIDQVKNIARELIPSYGKDCPVSVVYRVTWHNEKIIRTTLSELSKDVKKEGLSKTALIIVGHVLNKRFNKSKLYDKNFSHSFRKKHD
jgi:precorrin-4/cobalt-precorrin-4 C11-methyltransferase